MAAFKMEIDGEEVTFPSEEHAARFFLAKQRIAAAEHAVAPKKPNGKGKGADDVRLLISVMDAIGKAGDQGANSDAIADLLGVSDGRGIGSKLTGAKKVLKELGFPDNKAVFYRIRIPRVGRFWRAGPKFSAAIEALKKELTE